MAITIKYNNDTDRMEFHVKTALVMDAIETATAVMTKYASETPGAGVGMPKRKPRGEDGPNVEWPTKPDILKLVEQAVRTSSVPNADDYTEDEHLAGERIVANAGLI